MVGSSSSINGGALGEGQGDPCPLALSARQLVDEPVGELADPGDREGGGDRGGVGRRPLAEPPLVGMTSTADEIGDGEAVGGDRLLGQDAEPGGDGAGRELGDVLSVEQHRSIRRRQQPGEAAQQRRLAAGVGADDRRHPAGRDRQRQADRRRCGRGSRATRTDGVEGRVRIGHRHPPVSPTAGPSDEIEQVRRPDDGRDDADGQLGRGEQPPGDEVGGDDEQGTAGGGGQQPSERPPTS